MKTIITLDTAYRMYKERNENLDVVPYLLMSFGRFCDYLTTKYMIY